MQNYKIIGNDMFHSLCPVGMAVSAGAGPQCWILKSNIECRPHMEPVGMMILLADRKRSTSVI